MLFNTFNFLLFFPLVAVFYYIIPHKYRWFLLLAASCIFYIAFIPIYILILLTTIVIDYYAAIWIEKSEGKKRKTFLILSIISTCLVLGFFKYFNFFVINVDKLINFLHWNYSINTLYIILPIGLSFHTFQSLSYVIEVYRGKQKAEKNFGIYSLYVMFFPQLAAGPIERPQNLLPQFYEKHYLDSNNVSEGLKQILWGFFKKIVVADRLALFVNAVYNNHQNHSSISLILATLFFTIQVYSDFSGYSNIAIGTARVMGFRLMTNFRRPFFAVSFSDYWHRWHISLSTWFRDYIYIPMGGSRVKQLRLYFNLMTVFLISGLWHGANWRFVVWGGLNGSYVIFSVWKKRFTNSFPSIVNLKNRYPVINRLISVITIFLLISVGRVFYRANTYVDAIAICKKIVLFQGSLFLDSITNLVYGFIAIAILLAVEINEEYSLVKLSLFNNKYQLVRHISIASLVIIILMMGVFDESQFIYFQF